MKSVPSDVLDRILSELSANRSVSTKAGMAKLVNRIS